MRGTLLLPKVETNFHFKKQRMPTVLIGGGSGLVGLRLSHAFLERGYTVFHYSRTKDLSARFPAYAWNPAEGTLDPEPLEHADIVINLAGAGIADQPWTKKRKELIISSRVLSTTLLAEKIRESGHQPKAFLSASAIGYYGDRHDEWLEENSAPGKSGFLAESCKVWEHAITQAAETTGIRTAWVRIGLVLSTRGGALPKIMTPLHFRLGTYFGSGQQWYSWIHIDDLTGIFVHLAESESLSGPFNGVAPTPLRNKEFVREIMAAMKAPGLMLPAPEFALRLALGEMADAVLTGSRVSAQKILASGFEFQHPNLREAIQHLRTNRI